MTNLVKKEKESISAFYYRIARGNFAQTQEQHIAAMWQALGRLEDSGVAQVKRSRNGCGTLSQYYVEGGNVDFDTNSGDVFSQIQILDIKDLDSKNN